MTARVAVLDIESKPALAYAWQQWGQDLHNIQVIEPVSMLCFASGWEDESAIEFHAEWDDREAMVQRAWDILDEADGVVTYNGDRYDLPHLYREFTLLGLGPPSPFKSIDLYRVAKRLKFFSHKLDYVADQLRLGRKLDTGGFQLWLDVMAGDEKAQRKMERYNKRDVRVTKTLKRELLPWIKNPLNLNLFREDGEGCARCGSDDIQRRGYRTTAVAKFPVIYCKSCGGWSTLGKREAGADIRAVS